MCACYSRALATFENNFLPFQYNEFTKYNDLAVWTQKVFKYASQTQKP